jgi:DNA-binding CsgD family transcriptional regulator
MVSEKKTLSICDRLNFMKCDRSVLSLLPPSRLMQVQDSFTLNPIQPLLRQLEQALDQLGVISLAIDGQVQFMTPQAEHLLNQYLSFQNSNTLPDPLQRWFKSLISQLAHHSDVSCSCVPFHLGSAGQQLNVHLVSDPLGEQYLLLLEQQVEEQEPLSFSIASLRSLGLTQREAEVLFWVAKDKSNAAIAKVLDCCEGTVRKHLENLYKKLGVQTRIGAVVTALEMLGLLQS